MFDGSGSWKVAAALSAAVASGTIAGLMISGLKTKKKQKPEKWIRVGTVKELILYPVKSCQGIQVSEATATQIGFKGSDYLRDRVFMVVNDSSEFQTQRQLPRMSLIHTAVNGNQLTLNGPNMPHITIDIPGDAPQLRRSCRIFVDRVTQVLDCGDEIGNWLSQYLEKPGLRLYYHFLDKTVRSMNPLQKTFPTFVPEDKGSFQDQTSFMLMAEESLNYLNTKLETPVTHKNFRPNIMITATPEPFTEDFCTFLRLGGKDGPILKTGKPCSRCLLTTVIPEIGDFHKEGEPRTTLLKMQKDRKIGDDELNKLVCDQAVLGLQMGLYSGVGATVKVGDPVYVAAL